MTEHDAWFEALKAKRDREKAERLEAAREAAHAEGKEPFDLDRLEAMWPDNPVSFSPGGTEPARDARLLRWEREYYESFASIPTLQEFVDKMKSLEKQGYFD